MKKFRRLNADEIECRIALAKETGVRLLLYKDARCDMNILDETVGPENWQRSHSRDNANCTVSIWDEDKKQWISKEDTGTESFAEKEKGLASDSFKRSCFNWGIGRELYTAPFIWINDCAIKEVVQGGKKKYTCYEKFHVSEIGYDDKGCIASIMIKNENGKVVYPSKSGFAKSSEAPKASVFIRKEQMDKLRDMADRKSVSMIRILGTYKINKIEAMSMENYEDAMKKLLKLPDIPMPDEVDSALAGELEELPFD